MRRGILITWHALSLVLASVLYFYFVLPRWPELMGDLSHTSGTVLRIVTGVVLGLTALPVVFSLLKSRPAEFGTPQLALSMRFWAIVGQVLAGVLVVVTAVVEIWVSLDKFGQVLFGVYGAAAALTVLSALSFYLSFAAETAPPPPKPLKPVKAKKSEKSGIIAPADEAVDASEDVDDAHAAEEPADVDDAQVPDEEPAEITADAGDDEPEAETPRRGLRNRRPSGKSGRGGIALSD